MNASRGLVQELPTTEQGDINRCHLVAPLDIETIALQTGLEIAETTVGLTDPIQNSGILVCLQHTPICVLPPGWTGVWARDEGLPSGPWVPLPPEMAGDSQALSRALWTAETWRREREADATLNPPPPCAKPRKSVEAGQPKAA